MERHSGTVLEPRARNDADRSIELVLSAATIRDLPQDRFRASRPSDPDYNAEAAAEAIIAAAERRWPIWIEINVAGPASS